MFLVSGFFEYARDIFETASLAPDGSSPELSILIHRHGQIHVVANGESSLEALRAQHGCAAAFRVTRDAKKIRVEGRSGTTCCTLERPANANTNSASDFTNRLFQDRPLYSVAGTLALT